MAETSLGQLLAKAKRLQDLSLVRRPFDFRKLNLTILEILSFHWEEIHRIGGLEFEGPRPHAWTNPDLVLVIAYGHFHVRIPVPELSGEISLKVRTKMNIQAQMLYNLRQLTGFASGSDLQYLFWNLIGDRGGPTGGYEEFAIEALQGTEDAEQAKKQLEGSLRELLPHIAWNILYLPDGFDQEDFRWEEVMAFYRQQEPIALLDKIRETLDSAQEPITVEMAQPLLDQPVKVVMPKVSDMLGISRGFRWLSE